MQIYVNGILVATTPTFFTNGSMALPYSVPAGAVVGARVSNVGFANGIGLWVGLTTY